MEPHEAQGEAGPAICCPVCTADSGFSLVEKVDQFSIYRCPNCELQFAQPLSYSTGFYDEQYGSGPGLVRLRKLSRKRMLGRARSLLTPSQREALRWLKNNLAASASVLDIGCGSGWFLAALEREGFVAMGTEVAKEPVELLGEKGFRVQQGSVDALPEDWPQPNALMLSEVIEHLPQPVEFLETLRRRFPEAVLLLSTPSWQRWNLHLGYRQPHDYPPLHLTRWTEKSLALALKKAGYGKLSFLYPTVDSAEFYDVSLETILHRVGLYHIRSPHAGYKDRQGRSVWSKLVGRLSSLAIWANDAGRAASRILLVPLAYYFSIKRWSSGSMLIIALPPIAEDNK